MDKYNSINNYIEQSIKDNWERLAFTDLSTSGMSFQYRDVARKIAKLHLLFKHARIERGDKIALCGRNCAQWSVTFLACITYGATAVPILPDFTAETIHHLVNHSNAKLLFTDAATWDSLDNHNMPQVLGVVLLSDFSLLESNCERLITARRHLNEYFGKEYPERFTPDNIHYYVPDPEEIALINYTSGSTGFSKGVMLPYRSLWSNIKFTIDHLNFLLPGDTIVCMLPLAHMYGLSIEMLHPFVKGCHIYFISRTPSPRVILEAFASVRPKLVVAVPLIIEKIMRTRVMPQLDKPLIKLLLHVPVIDDKILDRIKAKVIEAFGGNLYQLILGGAPVNSDVESLLRRIRFPFTVGYGMTECGPLIAYEPWESQRQGSCGRLVDGMEMRVDSKDPTTVPGELYVRGRNLMKGYYKNDEATSDVISEDGWMNTGDIVNVDSDGFIYIRGRSKNMILGPSGQNIYPEEIEAKLNAMQYVGESIVTEENDDSQNARRLVALIHPDLESLSADGITADEIDKIMASNIAELNSQLPAYSRIARYKLFQEEFEKTPKRSIKRYMYTHS